MQYHDPYVEELTDKRIGDYSSVPLDDGTLSSADCVVILTNHDAVDVDRAVRESSPVLDIRNATSGSDAPHVSRL